MPIYNVRMRDKNFVMQAKVIELFNIVKTGNWSSPMRGRIYSVRGISPAINTVGGGGLEPKILLCQEKVLCRTIHRVVE